MGTDIADKIISHFATTGSLPEEVGRMKIEHIAELIDGIPDQQRDLVEILKYLLSIDGVKTL